MTDYPTHDPLIEVGTEFAQRDLTAGSSPGSSVPDVGTLVIYNAKWVPVARFVRGWVEDLARRGVRVLEVDVDTDANVPTSVAVLPTFIYWGAEGPRVRTGALDLADLVAWCDDPSSSMEM